MMDRMGVVDGTGLSSLIMGEQLDPREYLTRMHPEGEIPSLDHVVMTAMPVQPLVNRGVWIWRCQCGARGIPSPGGVVFFDYPLAWCLRCGNAATGRGWRPVALPSQGLRRIVESILLHRPNQSDRNWEPEETVSVLIEQNTEHGDGIPKFVRVRQWANAIMSRGAV